MKHVFLKVVQFDSQNGILADALRKNWHGLDRAHVYGSTSVEEVIARIKDAPEDTRLLVTAVLASTLLDFVEAYWPKTGPRSSDVEERIFKSLLRGSMMHMRIPKIRPSAGRRKDPVTCIEINTGSASDVCNKVIPIGERKVA